MFIKNTIRLTYVICVVNVTPASRCFCLRLGLAACETAERLISTFRCGVIKAAYSAHGRPGAHQRKCLPTPAEQLMIGEYLRKGQLGTTHYGMTTHNNHTLKLKWNENVSVLVSPFSSSSFTIYHIPHHRIDFNPFSLSSP